MTSIIDDAAGDVDMSQAMTRPELDAYDEQVRREAGEAAKELIGWAKGVIVLLHRYDRS